MSLSNQLPASHDCSGDAAAYALGALESTEARVFATHLQTCVVCRDELTAFQEVAGALPMAAPQHPLPRGLRRRVLAEVRPSTPGRRRERAVRPRSALSRPALAFGAAAMLAGATGAGLALGTRGGTHTRVLSAQVYGSSASAQLRLAGDHGELIVHHLPQPPAGRVYEVWLRRPGQAPTPTSALFSVTSRGDGNVDVPGSLRSENQVLVTQEPLGGSVVPTSGPVIVAAVS